MPFLSNHYTHEIIIFEVFRGLQLQLAGSVELISITVTVSLFFEENAVTEKNSPHSPHKFSRIYCAYSNMI